MHYEVLLLFRQPSAAVQIDMDKCFSFTTRIKIATNNELPPYLILLTRVLITLCVGGKLCKETVYVESTHIPSMSEVFFTFSSNHELLNLREEILQTKKKEVRELWHESMVRPGNKHKIRLGFTSTFVFKNLDKKPGVETLLRLRFSFNYCSNKVVI